MRQPCEVFSRSMGYIRPVKNFNIGKRQEYEDRKLFKESLCLKREQKKIAKDS